MASMKASLMGLAAQVQKTWNFPIVLLPQDIDLYLRGVRSSAIFTRNYLRAQRHHGFWRARLVLHHPNSATGDTYSSLIDNAQPPIAMIILAIIPLFFFWPVQMGPFLLFMFFILAALQIPMTIRLVKRTGLLRYSVFGFVSFIRAFARGLGLSVGLISIIVLKKK